MSKQIERVVVVISGGLDSTILAHLAVNEHGPDNVTALSFYYGQKQKVELELAAKTCKKLSIGHQIVDITFLGDMVRGVCANIAGTQINMPKMKDVIGDPAPVTYVPNRNSIMANLAASYAEANGFDGVLMGFQQHDAYGYWDCTEDFVRTMNATFALNRRSPVTLVAPFLHMSKKDELKLFVASGGNIKDLSTTLTCYDPNEEGHSCGVCPSCSERVAAFARVGVPDPVTYSRHIDWGKMFEWAKANQ